MDSDEKRLLRRIADSLDRIEMLLMAQAESEGYDLDRCPKCHSADLIDASTMGNERMACRNCSAILKKEAVRG